MGLAHPPAAAGEIPGHDAEAELLGARAPTPTADPSSRTSAITRSAASFFTNLLHYVKTGDFVEALLRDARDVNELAFAIGALCHYAADTEGHPIAVNRAVPLMYPKLQRKYGDSVPYDRAPKEHVLVEFAFDVLLVAHGGYELQAYHDFIGFEVAKPLLERAFRETYGLEMKDLFLSEDLAIGTYRHAVAGTIPDVTRIAWEKKQEQIQKMTPGAIRDRFVLTVPPGDYEQRLRHGLQEAGVLRADASACSTRSSPRSGRCVRWRSRCRTRRPSACSSTASRARAPATRPSSTDLRAGRLRLPNLDFDTGKPITPGEYALADKTLAELHKKVADEAHRAPMADGRWP